MPLIVRGSLLAALLFTLTTPLAPGAVGAAGAAGAAAPVSTTHCQGKRVTQTSDPQGPVIGTDGPDVLIAYRYALVRGRGGDDLICIVGGSPFVMAGGGADRVVTTNPRATALVVLGSGADTFEGNQGRESVYAASRDPLRRDRHRDVIRTGGGRDEVVTGERTSRANDDLVRTGAGDDQITVISRDHSGAVLHGGQGHDRLVLDRYRKAPRDQAWTLDVPGRQIRTDGVTVGRISSLESFDLRELYGASLQVIGSEADEEVLVRDRMPAALALGGGDDIASFAFFGRRWPASTVEGGEGRDRVSLDGVYGRGGPVTADLAAGTVHVPGTAGRAATIALTATEDLRAEVYRRPVTLIGDAGDNRLSAVSCGTTIHGGAGNDLLEGGTGVAVCDSAATLLGDDGDDVLVGGNFDDVLVGGPGRDEADGSFGTDICEAETVRRCEG